MAISSRLYFDENKPKYRHGCCHIQTAALVIGTLQLMCFLFELSDLTMAHRQRLRHEQLVQEGGVLVKRPGGSTTEDQQQRTSSDNYSFWPAKTTSDATTGGERYINYETGLYEGAWTPISVRQPWAHAADVVWNGLVAFSIILMFYSVKWTRPYLLAPKLIFDAIAAGIVTVGAAILLLLAMGTSDYTTVRRHLMPLSFALFAAAINCYIFFVTLRCFKYLMEKRAFLEGVFNGNVFVLPFTQHGDRVSSATAEPWHHHDLPTYGSVFSDVPPAYPGLVTPKSQQGAPPVVVCTTTTTGVVGNDAVPAAQSETTTAANTNSEQQPIATIINNNQATTTNQPLTTPSNNNNDNNSSIHSQVPPPTYEEAQKLNEEAAKEGKNGNSNNIA